MTHFGYQPGISCGEMVILSVCIMGLFLWVLTDQVGRG